MTRIRGYYPLSRHVAHRAERKGVCPESAFRAAPGANTRELFAKPSFTGLGV